MTINDNVYIDIRPDDFNLQNEYIALNAKADTGAIASFVGLVRGSEHVSNEVTGQSNKKVGLLALEIEHYPEMTEAVIYDICQKAIKQWQLTACRVIHRVGRLSVGEQIVLVLVSASHRKNAFAATEYIMDFLKTKAPFWKKAIRLDGEHWVDAKQSDQSALQKWHGKNF